MSTPVIEISVGPGQFVACLVRGKKKDGTIIPVHGTAQIDNYAQAYVTRAGANKIIVVARPQPAPGKEVTAVVTGNFTVEGVDLDCQLMVHFFGDGSFPSPINGPNDPGPSILLGPAVAEHSSPGMPPPDPGSNTANF